MILNKIEKLFEKKALNRYGLLLLKDNQAAEFIDECEKQGVNILGIDVFQIIGDNIQPLMDLGIDFTNCEHEYSRSDRYNMGRNKINNRDNIYYEIVTEL
ncbi:hypothetical protein [Pedobacter sp. SYP-B3415]|uniref:hypothetical protein n=1 Tax=Pedobacter sp. SYP-B3415 TaxID=2496641 RepID=UPI00101C1C63|nr:hypothetical protein [Pedobacter sp. SYP-B3415]